jgi:hypothetical protein
MRGGSLQALKELLGHADLKMTLRYAHLGPEHLRGEMLKTEKAHVPPSCEEVTPTSGRLSTEPSMPAQR